MCGRRRGCARPGLCQGPPTVGALPGGGGRGRQRWRRAAPIVSGAGEPCGGAAARRGRGRRRAEQGQQWQGGGTAEGWAAAAQRARGGLENGGRAGRDGALRLRRRHGRGPRYSAADPRYVTRHPERRPLLYLPGPARCGHFHHYPPHGGSPKLIPERCTEHPCPTTLGRSVTRCRVETMAEEAPPCRGRDDDARTSKGRVHYLSAFSSRESL